MPLGKPPLVELWFEFSAEPAQSSLDWGLEQVKEFFAQFSDEFVGLEAKIARDFHIENLALDRPSRVESVRVELEMVRGRTADNTRWLHVGKNRLIFNYLRADEQYPGFEALCDEALGRWEKYKRHFRPAGLRQAAIHYVDLVTIPMPQSGRLELDDYFRIKVDLPIPPFGPMNSMVFRCVLRPTNSPHPLELRWATEPRDLEQSQARFRLDWHLICHDGPDPVEQALRDGLLAGHACMWQCFRQSFTDAGWQLFEPTGNE